jgi:hypothetical protein
LEASASALLKILSLFGLVLLYIGPSAGIWVAFLVLYAAVATPLIAGRLMGRPSLPGDSFDLP